MLGQNVRLVYQFLLCLFLSILQGWETGVVILRSCLFVCLNEGRIVTCSEFSGL